VFDAIITAKLLFCATILWYLLRVSGGFLVLGDNPPRVKEQVSTSLANIFLSRAYG